jgi:protein-disulfide isomerase
VVYRDFAIRGEASFRAAEAAHCAGEQGRFWEYHDALFAGQSAPDGEPFSTEHLDSLGTGLGLDVAALRTCVSSGRHRPRVQSSTDLALARGYEGTPTYEVNGRVTSGAIPIDRWNELFRAYEAELGG